MTRRRAPAPATRPSHHDRCVTGPTRRRARSPRPRRCARTTAWCQAYEGGRVFCTFHLRANVVPVAVQLLPNRKDADGHWPLRPGIRTRRLWCRHGGRPARPAGSRHRRPRPHGPRAPRAPRRVGGRGRDGGRRRHPGPGPTPVPGRGRRGGGVRAARRRGLRGRPGLPAHRPRRRPEGPHRRRADGGGGGAVRAGVADRAHGARGTGQDGARRHAPHRAGLRGTGRQGDGHAVPRAPRLRPAQAGRARRRRPLLPVAVGADHRVQGHAHLRAAASVLPRPARPPLRVRARFGALAFLDQHVPELAARPPLPLPGPQRRDQHAGGQSQLDAGTGGAARDVADRRGPVPRLPDLHAGRERLGQLRRGARAAPPRGPLTTPRGADDDPRGVGEPHDDGPRAPRVLPLPRVADGALGRAGGGHLHRWHARRRRARPQRPAAGALLGHRRRPRRAGQRGRRARHRPRADRAQGAPAAGPHVPRRHCQGPPGRGRGDQVRAGGRAPLRGLAGERPDPSRRVAAAHHADAPARRRGHPAAPVRLHDRGATGHPRPHGPCRRRAGRLHGIGHLHRGPLRPLAPALRLLHPALRPGDQPAARRHPRGAGDLALGHHRARGQPARGVPGLVPADPAAAAGHRPRRPGQAHVRQRARGDAGLQGLRHRRALRHTRGGAGGCSDVRRRGRTAARPRRGAAKGLGRHRGGRQHHRAVGPQLDGRLGAHPLAAADGGRPPPPGAREGTDQGRLGGRNRRRPRSAPHGAPHRLRRGGGEPVSRPGHHRRHDLRGPARGRLAAPGAPQLHEGGVQGRAEGDVEDGHLHGGLLHRRPGVRGDRPRRRADRRVLHGHGKPHRRHRALRAGSGGGHAAPPGPRAATHRAGPPRAGGRRRVPVAPRGGIPSLQPEDRLQAPARGRGRSATRSSRSTPPRSTTNQRSWEPCAACCG